MGLEKYTEPVQKEVLTEWLKKADYCGQEKTFTIEEVAKLNNDMILKLVASDVNSSLLRIPATLKNELIDHFGQNVNLWEGNDITLSFEKFTPKAGQKISEGVSVSIVWPETVEMN